MMLINSPKLKGVSDFSKDGSFFFFLICLLASDWVVLAELYQSTNGGNWVNNNGWDWTDDDSGGWIGTTVCDAFGISCDSNFFVTSMYSY